MDVFKGRAGNVLASPILELQLSIFSRRHFL